MKLAKAYQKVPMMYRAQIGGRSQLQFISKDKDKDKDNKSDIEKWVYEWT